VVSFCLPEDHWVYGYILSFGEMAELLEPKALRRLIKQKLENSLKKYY
jgi:predicted DNA-binding transcriptional regulator YafY